VSLSVCMTGKHAATCSSVSASCTIPDKSDDIQGRSARDDMTSLSQPRSCCWYLCRKTAQKGHAVLHVPTCRLWTSFWCCHAPAEYRADWQGNVTDGGGRRAAGRSPGQVLRQ
jgi:hypothetical protein